MSTDNVGRVLVSIVVVLGFMTVTIMYLSQKIGGGTPGETLTLLVGALSSNFTSVVGYWIGASSGGAAARDQLSKTADKLAEKVPSAVTPAVIAAAAEAAAPAAAANAAPPAATEAAPPAVDAELDRRGVPDKSRTKK